MVIAVVAKEVDLRVGTVRRATRLDHIVQVKSVGDREAQKISVERDRLTGVVNADAEVVEPTNLEGSIVGTPPTEYFFWLT